MLNYIWSFLIIAGIMFASFTGNIENVSNSIISSAKDAIDLLIVMAGVVSMWNGFLTIADDSGLVKYLSYKMKPLLRFLFPNIPKDHVANDYICANFIANILGLGWACTPTGLQAMKALQELERQRRVNNRRPHSDFHGCHLNTLPADIDNEYTASDEMCTFLILNISSLQIIPMNMIAYRAQYGSPSPMAVIAPGFISTLLTTCIAIVICRIMCRPKT